MMHLVLILSLLAVPAFCQDALTVHDDFDGYADTASALGVWTPLTPDWRVEDGLLEMTEPRRNGTLIWRHGEVFGDVSVSVRFQIVETDWGVRAPGIVLASADSTRYYYVHFDSGNSQVILVRSDPERGWNELARTRNVDIPRDTWHEARFELEGGQLRAWLNDREVGAASDETYSAGVVGLRAGQGHVQFDDFRAEGVPATLEEDWRLVPGTVPDDDLSAPRLTESERVITSSGQGYFPVMIRMQDGSLGAVIRGGDGHIGIKGRLDFIRSTDGGRTWSEPEVIVDSEWDDRNPALGQMPDGTLVCAYAEAQTYNQQGEWDRSAGEYVLFYVLSTDGGRTWSEKEYLYGGPIRNASPYGKIVVTPDGTALMSLYGGAEPEWTGEPAVPEGARRLVGIVRSRDNGRTWTDFSFISTTNDHNETALLPLSDTHILAAARTYSGRWVEMTESRDGGYTWSEPQRVTESNQHPADLIRLDSGRILLTCGNRREPLGVFAMLSEDDGRTFDYQGRVMVEWRATSGDCGYPSSVQLEDGTIVTMYYTVSLEGVEGRELSAAVIYTEDMLLP